MKKTAKTLKKFSVDLQQLMEFTYQVEARNPREAEGIALALYEEGVPADHEEPLDDPTISRCEEL